MGKTENLPSIERATKLLDGINSLFFFRGKTMVGTRRKPSSFLPVQWKPRRMIGMEEKAFFLILGMTAKLKKFSLEKFVRGVV